MNVTVNGQDRDLAPGTTVAHLVEQAVGGGRGTAVAVDGSVVPRGQWSGQVLHEGNLVEMLTAVQGG